MKPFVFASTTNPSSEPYVPPCEFVISGEAASAAASARRARSIRSFVGRAAGLGSNRPRSMSSAGGASSGSPAAASSPVTRAMSTVSPTSVSRAGGEKSEV